MRFDDDTLKADPSASSISGWFIPVAEPDHFLTTAPRGARASAPADAPDDSAPPHGVQQAASGAADDGPAQHSLHTDLGLHHATVSLNASQSAAALADIVSITDAGPAAAGAPPTNAPQVFTLPQIIQQLRTQWGGSWEGTTSAWGGSGPINYYIGGPAYPSGSGEAAFVTGMTALMQDRAALAFELWDDLIARDLNRTFTAASNQIQFEYASRTYDNFNQLSTNGGTYERPFGRIDGQNQYGTSNFGMTRSEIWLNSNWTSHNQDSDMYFGGYGFQTYMHEIGHSLGLSHPGTYNANGQPIEYNTHAEYTLDTRQYTIMSYFGGYAPGVGWNLTNEQVFSATPQLHDIAAIQAMYGADMTTRATDTVYGFNSNAGRDIYNFNVYSSPIVTIWDGGGFDTLDMSGYSATQRIDLNAGTFSNIGGMIQNIAIAYNVVIEAAIGGSNHDTMIGNGADNTLRGNAGDDIIDGGGGIDRAVYAGPRAAYALTDLGSGGVRVVSAAEGTDTLSGIEFLVFSDQTVAWPPVASAGSVTISDATVTEGESGSQVMTFTVTRTGGTGAFSINYATANNTATAGSDYVATSGTLSFGDGVNTMTIAVSILGDAISEPTETFSVNLSGATNGAIISNSQCACIILDNDLIPIPNSYVQNDFDGDGRSDILWRDTSGINALWEMNGPIIESFANVTSVATNYKVAGVGDFDADGRSDILWRNTSGVNALWEMNGASIDSFAAIGTVGPQHKVVGIGDFNGDGRSDILWRNSDGVNALWTMNGATIQSAAYVTAVAPSYKAAGIGDFDGDGRSDILWRNDAGVNALWEMNGASIKSFANVPTMATSYQVAGIGDFDGDGRDDILWRHDSGANLIWLMNGSAIKSSGAIVSVGTNYNVEQIGDFDGDGRADILWRNTDGVNAVWEMNGTQIEKHYSIVSVAPIYDAVGSSFDII